MGTFSAWIKALNSIVWGPAMLLLILGTGFYLQLRLGGMPIRKIGAGLRLVWRGRGGDAAHGEVSPYSALMTCLAATIGVGNIAGVATAVALGGPGAVFWMWMTALVGMATKYAEVLLAVHFRERDAKRPLRRRPDVRDPQRSRAALGLARHDVRAVRRPRRLRHRQHGAVQQHRCGHAGLVRHQPTRHRRRAHGHHRRGDPRRHQAHRRRRELAGAVHGGRLRAGGAGRAGCPLPSRFRTRSR